MENEREERDGDKTDFFFQKIKIFVGQLYNDTWREMDEI